MFTNISRRELKLQKPGRKSKTEMDYDPAPETERIRRLKLSVSRLKLSEDDRAFLREAIDFLALQRANDRLMEAWRNAPPNEPLVRLRKTGWQMDAMLGIEHYEVAGHHVTVKFDRERGKDRFIVTVPTLADCHSAGHSIQDAINKIAAVKERGRERCPDKNPWRHSRQRAGSCPLRPRKRTNSGASLCPLCATRRHSHLQQNCGLSGPIPIW